MVRNILWDQHHPNARQARWLGFIPEFDFDIDYVKGEENCVAEALSRRLHATYVAAVNSYRIRSCGLEDGNGNQAEVSLVCSYRCRRRYRYRSWYK